METVQEVIGRLKLGGMSSTDSPAKISRLAKPNTLFDSPGLVGKVPGASLLEPFRSPWGCPHRQDAGALNKRRYGPI